MEIKHKLSLHRFECFSHNSQRISMMQSLRNSLQTVQQFLPFLASLCVILFAFTLLTANSLQFAWL
jgi:hypothetical protein